jgi:hypothetical protein
MGTHDGAVDHRVLVVGFPGQVLEHFLPHPALRPAAPAPMHILPVPEALRQIAPGNPSTIPVQHRLDKQPVIGGGAAHMPHTTRQKVFDPLPLVVTQSISSCHRFIFSTETRHLPPAVCLRITP